MHTTVAALQLYSLYKQFNHCTLPNNCHSQPYISTAQCSSHMQHQTCIHNKTDCLLTDEPWV